MVLLEPRGWCWQRDPAGHRGSLGEARRRRLGREVPLVALEDRCQVLLPFGEGDVAGGSACPAPAAGDGGLDDLDDLKHFDGRCAHSPACSSD